MQFYRAKRKCIRLRSIVTEYREWYVDGKLKKNKYLKERHTRNKKTTLDSK